MRSQLVEVNGTAAGNRHAHDVNPSGNGLNASKPDQHQRHAVLYGLMIPSMAIRCGVRRHCGPGTVILADVYLGANSLALDLNKHKQPDSP